MIWLTTVMGKFISYHDREQSLEGYLACPDSATDLPGVVIAPTWLNVNGSICKRADRLAELGYAAFVLDVFGKGVRPAPPQHPIDVIMPFLRDRLLFRRRLFAGVETLRLQPECSDSNLAAIGYCLGGCAVLELARSGAILQGVVSLHGVLNSPLPAEPGAIRAKILVLHGDDDPLVPFEQVIAFREEMRRAKANWEINLYSGAKHSFTGEGVDGASTPEAGLHPQTEIRSWQTMVGFLQEVLRMDT